MHKLGITEESIKSFRMESELGCGIRSLRLLQPRHFFILYAFSAPSLSCSSCPSLLRLYVATSS